MTDKLELVREEKLQRLLRSKKKRRLEASGVALLDDTTAIVVFDNLNVLARIDLSLEPRETNRFFPAPSLGAGFEDIAIDHEGGHGFCLIEALEDVDGLYRAFVVEYDMGLRFIRCTRLATEFECLNKGFEGLAHVRRGGTEHLLALCEGNLGTDAKEGGGRIDVFTRAADGHWDPSHRIDLPKEAEFADYASISHRDGRLALVSQESARLCVARLDKANRALEPGSQRVYRFPNKSYGNVEGIAWLSEDTLVAVSDKRKARQRDRCEEKDQSIHVFRIPSS